jgi:hypothetical protein
VQLFEVEEGDEEAVGFTTGGATDALPATQRRHRRILYVFHKSLKYNEL